MNNPLLDKFYEMFPEKKEKPKFIKAENATIDIKPRKIAKCYDPDSLKASFQQVAEQLQTGEAKIASMSIERNAHLALNKITFEFMIYEP